MYLRKICWFFLCVIVFPASAIEGEYSATVGKNCIAVEGINNELNKHGYFIKLIEISNGSYKAILPKASGAESEVARIENGEINLLFKGKGNQILMSLKHHDEMDNAILMTEWLNYMQHGLKEQLFDVLKDDFPNKFNPIKQWATDKGLCLLKNE